MVQSTLMSLALGDYNNRLLFDNGPFPQYIYYKNRVYSLDWVMCFQIVKIHCRTETINLLTSQQTLLILIHRTDFISVLVLAL